MKRINVDNAQEGVTLIEVLLVLAIVGMVMYMGVGYLQQQAEQSRIDQTSIQMQQILNAGLAYYVVNGQWPKSLNCLQGGDNCSVAYLPRPLHSPWAGSEGYKVVGDSSGPLYVYFNLFADAQTTTTANIIAGKIPLGYASNSAAGNNTPPANDGSCGFGGGGKAPTSCYVVGSVNIPGQNLNNAASVNFTGIYTHGGCVPVPQCPVDVNGKTMKPEIFAIPTSVTGITTIDGTKYALPITSFTAYAISDNNSKSTPTSTKPAQCDKTTESSGPDDCADSETGSNPAKAYWRVCLTIKTEDGGLDKLNTYKWGKDVNIVAITRCAIKNETSGTGFNVYSN